jgi:hypothetical protein
MNAKKPEIFIHIGTHKTGTTSLQYFLHLNRDLLLKSGILYPKTGVPDKHNLYGQHQLAWVLLEDKLYWDDDIWFRLKEECEKKRPGKIIISSEGFENLEQPGIERLKEMLHSDNIKIIFYLRSYLGFMKSLYFEVMKKNQFSGNFKDFIILKYSRLDYDSYLVKWSAIFGEENIILRLYDEIESNTGLIKDFCSIIGFDYSLVPDKNAIRINVTANDRTVNALRILNGMEKSMPGFLTNWIGMNNMRAAFANPKIRQGFRHKFLLSITRNRYYRERDLNFLRKMVSDMDQPLLRQRIGDEGIKILYKGL